MVFRKRNPGCPCCCDVCNLHDTDFATVGALTNYFTVWEGGASPSNVIWTAGTVKIDANPTTFVRVMSDTLHPLIPYAPRIQMQVKGAEGAILRALLSWSENSDSSSAAYSDGLIAELRPTADCAELYLMQVQSGVEYVREGPIPVPKAIADQWHTIEACYDPDTLTLSAIVTPYGQNENTEASVVLSSHTDGQYNGFGAPSASTQDAYFDDWDLDILWYCQGTATIETYQEGSSSSGGPVNEIQTLTIDADRGTYKLTFDGAQTGELAYNADAADIETALEGLPGIGSGNVTVVGTNPFTITFGGSLAGVNVDAIVPDQSCLQKDEDYDCTKVWCHDCHGGQCAWAVGHFDDVDNLSCEWEGDTGDWSIDEANEHMETTAASSIILHKTEYPWDARDDGVLSTPRQGMATGVDFYHHHRLLIAFEALSDDRTIVAIVAAEDTSNYVAAEVTVGVSGSQCGTFKLISVTSGTPADLSESHTIRGLVSGETFYLAVSFEDGEVKAAICSEASMIQATQGGTLLGSPMDTPWIRHIRGDTGTYHGPHVGIGTAGGSGEVDISLFEAGCQFPRDLCYLEEDYFDYDASAWRSCNWDLISGTLPTRVGGYLEFTSAALMLCKNPVPRDAVDDHGAGITHNIFNWTGNTDNVSVIFGSDAAATNYYRTRHTRTDDGLGGSTLTSTLERVNSGSPTTLDSGDGGGVQVTGCITEDLANSNTFSLYKDGVPGSYGPYCGVEISPGAGNTIRLTNFVTERATGESLNLVLASSYQVRCIRCGAFGCGFCEDNALPGEYLVEIDSWGSWIPYPGVSCCTCAALEGTSFYAEFQEYGVDKCGHIASNISICTPSPACSTSCCTGLIGAWVWVSTTNAPYCSATNIYDQDGVLVPSLPTGLRLRVLLSISSKSIIGNPVSSSHLFISDDELTNPTDCLSFNQVPCSWIGRTNNWNDDLCDPEKGSTCQVLVTSV